METGKIENTDPQREASKERVRELQAKIADLRKRWPAHSIPPAMLQQLDDLEDELKNELTKKPN